MRFRAYGENKLLKGIMTKFCMWVDFLDLIMWATFGDDRLWGLGVARGRISRFPIDLRRRPILSQCRTAVLHCCKGDAASQWEMAILGCQNSVTDRLKFDTRDYVGDLTSYAKFHKIRRHKD